MELNKRTIKIIIGLITFALLLSAGLRNILTIWDVITGFFSLIFPFILGGCIAFILNIPMSVIEHRLFKTKQEQSKWKNAAARPASLILSILLVILILVIISFIIIPEMGRTFVTLGNSIPEFIATVQQTVDSFAQRHANIASQLSNLSFDWKNIEGSILDFAKHSAVLVVNSTFGTVSSIAGGIISFFLGLIFAVYVLLQKERLGRQCRKLFYAFIPERIVDRGLEIIQLSNRTFSSFVTGQCTEAVIIGMIFFLVLTILRFPYALMIGVMIGFLALIPIFGAFIGCVLSFLLILMVNPMQALLFIIVFLIIQQIEGNLIYPHVVGGSVGLPSIWVLVAVTVGGNAFGIVGMIIVIPIFSVLYTLLREAVVKRLKERQISREKFENIM